ncbi:MAG TPA: hypothetical protein VE934_12095 [Polaromonas sp.]|uniref:hypothetical protein n=1 Tax=Polaromonas sp. TaxID=1869339 RepID=UPI002D4D1E4E|nr:hypothetical protein [Polaromonas sp.]HYW57697.1 hypothetical protein [Polaromonas sp.]
MDIALKPGDVYKLPSGRYARIDALPAPHEVKVHLVNVKLMRRVPASSMVLCVAFVTRRGRICWKAADWQRRIDDAAAERAEEAARKERRELAAALDVSRAAAIDREHAALKAANLRLRLAA